MAQIKIVIGGDVCPTERDQALFKEGNADGIFHDLLEEFTTADLAIVNLEFPLIEEPSPIRKTGPVLAAPSECVKGLVSTHIKCVGLANNHIRDHGAKGVDNTLRVCSRAGLLTFGAGHNLEEAGRLQVVKVGNVRIGLLAIAEQEWSIATNDRPGANPVNAIHVVRSLQKFRGSYDFLIVLFHSGIEHYPFPTPGQMEMSRFIIEQGARIVLAAGRVKCLDQPEGADVERGLGEAEVVLGRIAEHVRAAAEPLLHRAQRALEPQIARRQESQIEQLQQTGVEIVAREGRRESLGLRTPRIGFDPLAD